MKNSTELLELIKEAKRILIVSHTSPDPDAISSSLFTYNILKKAYPKKELTITIENAYLDKLGSSFDLSEISTFSFKEAITKLNPELIIATDIGKLEMITRDNISTTDFENIKLAIIDHHEKVKYPKHIHYTNMNDTSCAQTCFDIFYTNLKFKLYPNAADEVLLGVLGDTGNLRYLGRNHKETFNCVSKLIDLGGNVDKVTDAFTRLTNNELAIYREFLNNLSFQEDFTYTYLRDEFFATNPEIKYFEVSSASGSFVQQFIKNTGNSHWGFIVKKTSTPGVYGISFRSETNSVNVAKLASNFNGGGHINSSGGRVEAETVYEAIALIIQTIAKYRDEINE